MKLQSLTLSLRKARVKNFMSFFFIYTRLSIIVVNALILILFSSAFYISDVIVGIKYLFIPTTDKLTVDWTSSLLMLFIFIYIFSTLFFTIIYLALHRYFVRKGWRKGFSKFDLFTLIQFIFIVPFMIILAFIGFAGLDWYQQIWNMLDDSSVTTNTAFVLSYGIPTADIFTILPLLFLNIMCFLDDTWKTFRINAKNIIDTKSIKNSFQFKMTIRVLLIICISFILIFWGDPWITILTVNDIPMSITKSDWYVYILQFIPVYMILLFILSIFVITIAWYIRHIVKERDHKSRQLPNYDFLFQLVALIIISIFILVMIVSPFWVNYDKDEMMWMTLNVVDLIFVFPISLVYIINYCKNMRRIYNE